MEILSEFDLEDYRILTIKIPKNASIKEVRSKRSRNANNYFGNYYNNYVKTYI